MANNPKNEDEIDAKVQDGTIHKELISEGVYGKVKWFNVKRGYGFVCRNDNNEDVFIHQSAIVKSNPDHPRKSVGEGEEIQFDIVNGVKGKEAANVCGADGNHVKGSEYALRYQRGRYRGGRGGRGRSRGPSEDAENHVQEPMRGGGGGGRNFRGGRPYMMQYRRPYNNYDMPMPPPPFYYEFDYYRGGPMRGGRGGFGRGGGGGGRGGYPRGGPQQPREMGMTFPPYDYEFERRPPPPRGGGGRGRPRFRGGRGRGWGGGRGREGPQESRVKDEGEEQHESDERHE